LGTPSALLVAAPPAAFVAESADLHIVPSSLGILLIYVFAYGIRWFPNGAADEA
jgi:hypothetical protein